jgi:hypothetical protein
MVAINERPPNMASRRTPKPSEDVAHARDRVDLRADPAWVARIERQAARLGQSVSSYIRLAVTLKLEADEANEPKK